MEMVHSGDDGDGGGDGVKMRTFEREIGSAWV
jgi:hypothetical protein